LIDASRTALVRTAPVHGALPAPSDPGAKVPVAKDLVLYGRPARLISKRPEKTLSSADLGTCPLQQTFSQVDDGTMSMYSEILAKALEDELESEDATSARPMSEVRELFKSVNERRARVLETTDLAPEDRVACEIAYDVAIMKLCAAVGIEVTPDQFSFPTSERAHLERQLAEAGMPACPVP
jgi:hypothetical protein